jgi:hypothetical protein
VSEQPESTHQRLFLSFFYFQIDCLWRWFFSVFFDPYKVLLVNARVAYKAKVTNLDWSGYHVAYTFDDSSKQQALYVDGIQVVAVGVAASKTIGYDTQPLLLGRDDEDGVSKFFLKGRIDEAAIYNRALNPIEIASIYNVGLAGKRLWKHQNMGFFTLLMILLATSQREGLNA